MSQTPIQVVVAFDFTQTAEGAMLAATELAQRAGAHVFHFACIIDRHRGVVGVPSERPFDYHYAELVQQTLAMRIERELLAHHVAGAQFFVHARFGHPAAEILRLAKDVGAGLIVIGSNGLTGVERALIGSVSESVVRGARCSVMVARPSSYEPVKLVPVVEVERSHPYIPPHRYSYEDHRAIQRPLEWPLY